LFHQCRRLRDASPGSGVRGLVVLDLFRDHVEIDLLLRRLA
jgi:hypothetical protein